MNNFLNYRNPFGLYIHIPFCKSKCNYCDFYSIKNNNEDTDKYIDALVNEINLYADNIENKNIRTIYIGGGTPSILKPKQVEEILNTIYKNFYINNTIEVTMEANPESLNEEKIKKYSSLGINRLSLGVQSFLNEELNFLGRIHNVKESVEKIKIIKKYFDNFNLDIIFALPEQKFEDFQYNLNQLLNINPPHISLYNLQIEKNTKLYDLLSIGEIEHIEEELDYKMYNYAVKKFKEKGYIHYEISNFAKKDYESEHNLIYWKYQPYLGLGPSAHGFNGEKRYYNIPAYNQYVNLLENKQFPIQEVINLSKKELISEMMFMGLRLTEGVSKTAFKDRFNLSIKEVYEDTIKKLKRDNLIQENNNKIYLTKKGLNLGNISFAEFLL